MIVLDASAAVDLLLNLEPRARFVRRQIERAAPALHAPHLLDAEVAQVLRRYVLQAELPAAAAEAALVDLADLPLTRYRHGPFLHRALELRDNVTVYDALYLALAESLPAVLLTSDRALEHVPGCQAQVVLASG
jgi:predicted nucleic acid-binding protein